MEALELDPDRDRRYVLGFGDDAEAVVRAPGVTLIRQLPRAALVQTDRALAAALAAAGEYVAVYRSIGDALLAIAVFES